MIAEESILKKHGVETIPGGIISKKWGFHTNKSTICSENELNAIAKRICKSIHHGDEYIDRDDDRIEVHGALLHLPCMIFHKNTLIITAPSGLKVSLFAEDALKLWVLEHLRCNEAGKEINNISVPFAWKNVKAREEADPNPDMLGNSGIIDAQQTHWDWTFSCTDYCSTISTPSKCSPTGYKQYLTSARYISNINANCPTRGAVNSVFPFISNNIDCNNKSSVSDLNSASSATPFQVDSKSEVPYPDPGANPQWEAIQTSGINRQMLQEKDDILFYDDVVLYQDDLEDCGEVTLSAKVRVMPKCWFVLLRLYLRIDGGVIRVRDTRIFYPFPNKSNPPACSSDPEYIYMDVTWHESSISVVQAAMGRGNQLMESSLRKDPSAVMMFLPLVNDAENVIKHHRLKIN